jgi:hypothetical protein
MQSRIYSVEDVQVEGLMVIPENPPAISVSASGKVPTSGWTHADIAPWIYITIPRDGILDLDFIASPPTGIALQVVSKISITKAFPVPRWVTGVRVHTSTNEMSANIAGAKMPEDVKFLFDGLPTPWPFPWWAPHAKI